MATPQKAPMKLTQDPEVVTWPETHYVFVEKVGPFQNTAPQAWQEVHPLVARISEHNKVTGYMSLYKIGPKIYRAGVAVTAEPKNLLENMRYEKFKGGKYSRFVLIGSYANLPEASGRVFEIVAEKKKTAVLTALKFLVSHVFKQIFRFSGNRNTG